MTAIERLRALPHCAELSEDALQGLAALTHEVRFRAGELMLRQGEPAAHAYAIAEGQVAVLRSLPGGGELLLAEVGPGGFMGKIGLLAEQARIASVRAVGDVHAIKFDRVIFTAACEMRQPVAREMLLGVIGRVCVQVRGLIGQLGAALPPATDWSPDNTGDAEPLFDYHGFLPLLRCAPTFGEEGLARFAELAMPRQLSRGGLLFDAGEKDTGIALVVRGALELIARGAADSQAMQVFGPGAICGLLSAVDHLPHAGVAQAREHTLVLHLAQDVFDQHLGQADEFGFSLMSAVGEQLADSMPRLSNRLAQQVGLHRAQALLTRGMGEGPSDADVGG